MTYHHGDYLEVNGNGPFEFLRYADADNKHVVYKDGKRERIASHHHCTWCRSPAQIAAGMRVEKEIHYAAKRLLR